ncbi:MAG: 16S rRNA (cytosine(967)-C(5))-methyltransferase RsmB [Clostridia bacterium]|nr:16S rRNA (cytosine(967)-C(5))-methyltransferase RsmB [Clostridia bacterium]
MKRHIDCALKILTKVFSEKTYSNIAFHGEKVSDMTTKLVYGVLDENVKIEYILSQLVKKKPQNIIYNLLKIGVYALTDLTDVPEFAIVSECVEVAKMNGKSANAGFVNAVLKKVARGEYSLPSKTADNYLSVVYSKPQWFVDKLIEQYGNDTAVKIVSAKPFEREHVRVNSRLTTLEEVKSRLEAAGEDYLVSDVNGLIVKATDAVGNMFKQGLVTYQSPSSMLAVYSLGIKDGSNVLDLCSAPGGKAVLMSELNPQGKVVACDVYEHRVKLIESYEKRMRATNVQAVKYDSCKFNPEWENKFDFVLLDAPCSCFGTFGKHPDVFLSRGESDVLNLAKTQQEILKNAVRYLKNGGALVYSTCTLFAEENIDVVKTVLTNKDYSLEKITFAGQSLNEKFKDNDGTISILPNGEYDGFFIAKIRRK